MTADLVLMSHPVDYVGSSIYRKLEMVYSKPEGDFLVQSRDPVKNCPLSA